MSNSSLPSPASALQTQFGKIDIYLFDQLHRGRITQGMKILDAGCGRGRNSYYLIKQGFDVTAVDPDPNAVSAVSQLAAKIAPNLPVGNFVTVALESMEFAEASFDAVICNAVLHFAQNEQHFWDMLINTWRVLKPQGLFFSRLASSIGIEDQIELIEGKTYKLPDSSRRYLVDEEMLLAATERLGGSLLDPLKTTVVQGQRAMTTWVLRKN